MKRLNGAAPELDDDAKRRQRLDARILKLAGDISKKHAETGLMVRELVELVAEGQTGAKAFYVRFKQAWEMKTEETYVGNEAADLGQIRALRKKLSDEQMAERARRFFNNGDPFAEKCGWSLGCFVKMAGQLGVSHRSRGGESDLLERAGF